MVRRNGIIGKRIRLSCWRELLPSFTRNDLHISAMIANQPTRTKADLVGPHSQYISLVFFFLNLEHKLFQLQQDLWSPPTPAHWAMLWIGHHGDGGVSFRDDFLWQVRSKQLMSQVRCWRRLPVSFLPVDRRITQKVKAESDLSGPRYSCLGKQMKVGHTHIMRDISTLHGLRCILQNTFLHL